MALLVNARGVMRSIMNLNIYVEGEPVHKRPRRRREIVISLEVLKQFTEAIDAKI